MAFMTHAVLLLLLAQGITALKWTWNTLDQSTAQACPGDNMTLSWLYTLDGKERLESISWLRTDNKGGALDVIAAYSLGTFIASSSLEPRLLYAGNASIVLTGAMPEDSGNYTAQVLAIHDGGSILSIAHSVFLQVEGPLSENCQKAVNLTELAARLHELEIKQDASVKELELLRQENVDLRNKLNHTEADLRHALNETRTELKGTALALTRDIAGVQADVVEVRDKALKHVGFHAVLGRSVEIHITSQRIKFELAQFNDGDAYNATDGIFTAPVSGSYFFAYSASPYSTNHTSNAFLSVNGKPTGHIYNMYGAAFYNMATAHAVVHLAEGHRVWVMGSGPGAEFFDPLTFFSGFLIQEF